MSLEYEKYHLVKLMLISLSLLCGCKSSDDPEVIHNVSIDVESKLSEPTSIFDIFSQVELVALDNSYPMTNHVYVGASNMAFDGETFYILDINSMAVNAYDMNGNLKYHANKVGRGPGEYTMADQIMYNVKSDKIEILNPMCKIMRYTKDSLMFDSVLDFSDKKLLAAHNFAYSTNDYIIYSYSADEQLWHIDTESKELHSCHYSLPMYLREYLSPQAPFLEIDGHQCIFRPYDGLISAFDECTGFFRPFLAWNFEEYQCKLKDIPENLQARKYHDFIIKHSKHFITPFIDVKACGKRLFANVIFDGGKTHTIYYNLDTGDCHFFEKTTEDMKFLTELFYGEKMYKFIDYYHLPEYVNADVLDDTSRKAYNKVISEEGCAIIVYTLKPI